MMKKEITLNDIAGYATEKTIWQMLLNLSCCYDFERLNGIMSQSVVVAGNEFLIKDSKALNVFCNKSFSAPETFGNKVVNYNEKSAVWTLGALAFYTVTGTDVFEGKGGATQTKDTEIPRLSSSHASQELSALIRQCLSCSPQDRPTMDIIRNKAQAALAKPTMPCKKLTCQAGKIYAKSLIKFWPEEMVSFILVFFLLLGSINIMAQSQSVFNKTAIPNEMASLVLRCIDLRSQQNVGKVSKAMDRDMNWTMMDELPLDKAGECTTKDAVDVFGINDIGFSILKRHGGVTNAGGRFRDGRDPRYKYSFIEITVKQGKTVHYNINGREGEQLFAIVPFDKNARFEASIPNGKTFHDNSVCYIQLKRRLTKNDSFPLTIKNNSGKNMSFVLINYNSRNNE